MQATEKSRIFLSPPHMGGEEMQFIEQAFESNYIAPLGPMVDAFEREFAQKVGARYALAVSSGTAAMHLALRTIGVCAGDEVFASTLTFIGSVTPIAFQGAKPVFIDSDRQTWCMDPDLLRSELDRCAAASALPKAVVPTDIYGQCSNYDDIYACCSKYGIPVIVDAAEALGARYRGKNAGTGAAAAIFSFNGNKIITTSSGGMLVSDSRELIDRAQFLSQQARDTQPHYEHSEIGYNYRMSSILAALGRAQLRVLEKRVEEKRSIYQCYRDKLQGVPGIEFMPEAPNVRCNRWLTVILINPGQFGSDREAVRIALENENIESRPVWKPMHTQPVFSATATEDGRRDRPSRIASRAVGGMVAEDFFYRGLCLPSGTALMIKDIDRIVSIILNCRK
jgi:dTDP-4-amino-4,6-dideoxygalactose transaminase